MHSGLPVPVQCLVLTGKVIRLGWSEQDHWSWGGQTRDQTRVKLGLIDIFACQAWHSSSRQATQILLQHISIVNNNAYSSGIQAWLDERSS